LTITAIAELLVCYYSAQNLIVILPSHGGKRLSRPRWLAIYRNSFTQHSTIRAQHRVTSLIQDNALSLSQTATGIRIT